MPRTVCLIFNEIHVTYVWKNILHLTLCASETFLCKAFGTQMLSFLNFFVTLSKAIHIYPGISCSRMCVWGSRANTFTQTHTCRCKQKHTAWFAMCTHTHAQSLKRQAGEHQCVILWKQNMKNTCLVWSKGLIVAQLRGTLVVVVVASNLMLIRCFPSEADCCDDLYGF